MKLYQASDVTDAHLVVAYLESQGVEAWVEGESLATVAGVLGFGQAIGPVVLVDDADAERAIELMQERPTNPAPTHCHTCGYDLQGLPEPRCPECGSPFERPERPSAEAWRCPQCGEESEGQFTECWSCGAARAN